MKIQTYNNDLSPFIIEISKGIYLKEYQDSIGYTTNKHEASRYDLGSQATEAIERYRSQPNSTIIPPQDISDELFPGQNDISANIAAMLTMAALMGMLLAIILKIFW